MTRPNDALRLAVVGDVHGCFDAVDAQQLAAGGYDRILFVGDLAAFTHRSGMAAARCIAPLADRALVLFGNHDGVLFRQLVAEAKGHRVRARILGVGMKRRVAALTRALGGVPLCGYSRHELRRGDWALTLIAARPHSMGGPRLGYPHHLARAFGVSSLEESAWRLRALVDAAEAPDLFFLAHNGPTGLGAARDDLFGCDFHPEEGDWGDADLRDAIDYAASCGKRVRAVVAGHMHHELKEGGQRRSSANRDGTLYLNVARVPRIESASAGRRRHHVVLTLSRAEVSVEERWLDDGGALETG